MTFLWSLYFAERSERDISIRTLRVKLLWVVFTVLSGSAMWDYFVDQYRGVFEVTLPSSSQQVKNNHFWLRFKMVPSEG